MKYIVTVSATDWCGYDETFTVEADNEDQAAELAEQEFIQHWDLVQDSESGNYGELCELDDEGEWEDPDGLTGITIGEVAKI
jgi:hypothetical protein